MEFSSGDRKTEFEYKLLRNDQYFPAIRIYRALPRDTKIQKVNEGTCDFRYCENFQDFGEISKFFKNKRFYFS